MDIAIRSRNLELTDSLRRTVEDRVIRLTRHFADLDRAEVCLREERNPRITERDVCELTVSGPGLKLRAKAAAADAISALEAVVIKIERRMAKMKGNIFARTRPRSRILGSPTVESSPVTSNDGRWNLPEEMQDEDHRAGSNGSGGDLLEEASLRGESTAFPTSTEAYRRRDGS